MSERGSHDGDPRAPDSARAIVAAHGELAGGLVSAVAQITGRGGLLVPLSNVGLGREQLESVLRERLAEHAIGIVFTDLPGGSWTIAARRVQRDMPTVVVVTGVNLAMLLEYVFHDEAAPAGHAAAAAVEKGRSAMLVVGGAVVD